MFFSGILRTRSDFFPETVSAANGGKSFFADFWALYIIILGSAIYWEFTVNERRDCEMSRVCSPCHLTTN